MFSDTLLTEVERQRKYLDKLPSDYKFPLFNATQALESQRKSGYRDTASAAREIVDNAIEARASRIDVVFDAPRNGRKVVKAVAFIDTGSGMLPEMARYALSWGGGTHFEDASYIGKFGFGLPNASINQARRVRVYTRTEAEEPFSMAYLDIDEFTSEFGLQEIPEPKEAELPNFVQAYMKRNGIEIDHGTVVVWDKPDRLTYKTPANLKEHLLNDFGVTYRYMLHSGAPGSTAGALQLRVEGVRVEPVDPLFLLPGARLYKEPEKGGAQLIEEHDIVVKYYQDPQTEERHLKRIEGEEEFVVAPREVVGTIGVRIARFPIGLVEGTKTEDNSEEFSRFEIRKSHRGMSFVRVNRELQTLDLFPRTLTDISSGLGRWPLLQGYAYHWGIEVKFGPELDEVFGITNDKQGVRPLEDFWRVLTEVGIDAALRRENQWQSDQRKKKRDVPEPPKPGRPSTAERAAQDADVSMGSSPRIPNRVVEQVRQSLEIDAQRRVGVEVSSIEEAREAQRREAQRRRYRVEYFDNEHGPFYKPEWFGSQVVVKINRRHPFYEIFYTHILALPDDAKAKAREGLDLMLIALARAELSTEDPQQAGWYQDQREDVWSAFLKSSLRNLDRRLETTEVEEELETDDSEQEKDPAA